MDNMNILPCPVLDGFPHQIIAPVRQLLYKTHLLVPGKYLLLSPHKVLGSGSTPLSLLLQCCTLLMVYIYPAIISTNSPFVNLSLNYTNSSIPFTFYLSFYSVLVLFTTDSAHATLGSCWYVNTPASQHSIIFKEEEIIYAPLISHSN